jgi:hypothetical protein
MKIQWFPGHMHKASKEIKQKLPEMDLLIEVLDARLPGSSENPMLAKIRGDKPCIKIFNKDAGKIILNGFSPAMIFIHLQLIIIFPQDHLWLVKVFRKSWLLNKNGNTRY